MSKIAHDCNIGVDASRDWLDIHTLPDGSRRRLPNTPAEHAKIIEMARDTNAVVCFEATGGQEWRLWTALDVAGAATRQLPPAQIKAFTASRGTSAEAMITLANMAYAMKCWCRLDRRSALP